MLYFWHSNWHYFGYVSGKLAKPHFIENPQKSLKHANTYINRATNYEITALKRYERFVVFFGGSFFLKKNCWHLEVLKFWWIKYLGKALSYLKKWGVRVNYCWNYGPSKLLFHFIEYRLDQLISKHTKIAVNSTIQYFEGCSRKKYLLKVWKFLVHPPQNAGPVKFLQNIYEIF